MTLLDWLPITKSTHPRFADIFASRRDVNRPHCNVWVQSLQEAEAILGHVGLGHIDRVLYGPCLGFIVFIFRRLLGQLQLEACMALFSDYFGNLVGLHSLCVAPYYAITGLCCTVTGLCWAYVETIVSLFSAICTAQNTQVYLAKSISEKTSFQILTLKRPPFTIYCAILDNPGPILGYGDPMLGLCSAHSATWGQDGIYKAQIIQF